MPGTLRNIGSITLQGGWKDSDRDRQSYTIRYSPGSDSGTFLPLALAEVNYNPPDTTHPQGTKVTSSHATSIPVLMADVAALQFNFDAMENS